MGPGFRKFMTKLGNVRCTGQSTCTPHWLRLYCFTLMGNCLENQRATSVCCHHSGRVTLLLTLFTLALAITAASFFFLTGIFTILCTNVFVVLFIGLQNCCVSWEPWNALCRHQKKATLHLKITVAPSKKSTDRFPKAARLCRDLQVSTALRQRADANCGYSSLHGFLSFDVCTCKICILQDGQWNSLLPRIGRDSSFTGRGVGYMKNFKIFTFV